MSSDSSSSPAAAPRPFAKVKKPVGRVPRRRPFDGLVQLNWLQVALRLGEAHDGPDRELEALGPFARPARKPR